MNQNGQNAPAASMRCIKTTLMCSLHRAEYDLSSDHQQKGRHLIIQIKKVTLQIWLRKKRVRFYATSLIIIYISNLCNNCLLVLVGSVSQVITFILGRNPLARVSFISNSAVICRGILTMQKSWKFLIELLCLRCDVCIKRPISLK